MLTQLRTSLARDTLLGKIPGQRHTQSWWGWACGRACRNQVWGKERETRLWAHVWGQCPFWALSSRTPS